jgi:sugar phosphate isomerase/epimerase
MPQSFRGSLEGTRAFIKTANEISEKLSAVGMKFAYHNHNFEFEKYEGKTFIDTLIEELNPEIEFIIDTYWVQAGGADPVEYINKVAGRMSVCHFKDMAITVGQQCFAEIGNGNMNFKAIYKACELAGVRYIVIEQDHCNGDPFESLKISLDYMNKNF